MTGGQYKTQHTGTSKGLSHAINRGPIRKYSPKYANAYVTIQSHGLSAGAWTHYVTVNGVRNGLGGVGGVRRRGEEEGVRRGGGGGGGRTPLRSKGGVGNVQSTLYRPLQPLTEYLRLQDIISSVFVISPFFSFFFLSLSFFLLLSVSIFLQTYQLFSPNISPILVISY